MKNNITKIVDIIIETVNYIIISYALSSMAVSFSNQWLYILFFASDIWFFSKYFDTIKKISDNKIIPYIMALTSLIIVCGIMYVFGYVEGNVVPFIK